jgi:hypothetical protein
MTKKEQAAMEAALTAAALRSTEGCDPDVMPPTYAQGYTALSVGWAITGATEYQRIVPACSSVCSHSVGRMDKTTSQHPKPLFSTRLKALKQARKEVERHCAGILRRIDNDIAQETANPTALP